jgi:hypothetical protein
MFLNKESRNSRPKLDFPSSTVQSSSALRICSGSIRTTERVVATLDHLASVFSAHLPQGTHACPEARASSSGALLPIELCGRTLLKSVCHALHLVEKIRFKGA